MKNILKYLTIAGVLILFLPFFRMCSDYKKIAIPENATISEIDTINQYNINEERKVDKKNTYSGFGLGIYFFKMTFVKEQNTISNSIYDPNKKCDLKKEYEKVKTVRDFFLFIYTVIVLYFPFLFFVFIILNSFLLIYYSFKNKFKKIQNVTIINVSMLIISYLLMYLGLYLVKFNQIKYGSYLFVINSILIIYFAIKNKRNLTK